ncbi:MAG: hypothetical protein MUC35_04570 [Candidatus Margulisbacteria bacterium]|jgi:hypothetical protein|nr:hypothetical protein [Candidatus Margulisiibacteriota bacterium]
MFKILGIITYALVLTTVLSGLLRAKLSLHKALAIAAVTAATIHGGLILFLD